MAASNPKRRIGCRVTSAASLGVLHSSEEADARADLPVLAADSAGLAHHPDGRAARWSRRDTRQEERLHRGGLYHRRWRPDVSLIGCRGVAVTCGSRRTSSCAASQANWRGPRGAVGAHVDDDVLDRVRGLAVHLRGELVRLAEVGAHPQTMSTCDGRRSSAARHRPRQALLQLEQVGAFQVVRRARVARVADPISGRAADSGCSRTAGRRRRRRRVLGPNTRPQHSYGYSRRAWRTARASYLRG